MINKLILMMLIVSVLTLESTVLTEKGSGISDEQLNKINQIITNGRKHNSNQLYNLAVYIKGQLQRVYGQYWLVEIASGAHLVHGTAGAYYTNDQWLKLTKQNGTIFYWISVPASTRFNHYDLPVKENFIAKKNSENQKTLKILGSGISPAKQREIENMMKNAQLSKGNHPQACANVVGQKLEDSDGQNWIVEIYGSDIYDLDWGRYLLKFKEDQYLVYTEYGNYGWQYLIWVPGY